MWGRGVKGSGRREEGGVEARAWGKEGRGRGMWWGRGGRGGGGAEEGGVEGCGRREGGVEARGGGEGGEEGDREVVGVGERMEGSALGNCLSIKEMLLLLLQALPHISTQNPTDPSHLAPLLLAPPLQMTARRKTTDRERKRTTKKRPMEQKRGRRKRDMMKWRRSKKS